MTLQHIRHSFGVLFADLGYFTVQLFAEVLLNLAFFLPHLSLMLFEVRFSSFSLRLQVFRPFLHLDFKLFHKFVQIAYSVLKTVRFGLSFDDFLVKLGPFSLSFGHLLLPRECLSLGLLLEFLKFAF